MNWKTFVVVFVWCVFPSELSFKYNGTQRGIGGSEWKSGKWDAANALSCHLYYVFNQKTPTPQSVCLFVFCQVMQCHVSKYIFWTLVKSINTNIY